MELVKPSAEIVAWHCDPALIEAAGRTCYKSEPKGDPEGFCRKIMSKQHESVIEHSMISVRFIVDRGVSHELVRHRLASFCLSGDTILVAFKDTEKTAGSQKRWTIRQLFEWQDDPKRKGRIKLIRLRSVNDDGVLVPGKIDRIIDSGIQEVFQLRCKSGRMIKATSGHRFLTSDGWVKLEQLRPGSRIYANGLPALQNKEWLYEKFITENNTLKETAKLAGCCVTYVTKALRSFGISKPLSMRKNRKPGYGRPGMHSLEEGARISSRMSGSNNHRWKGDAVSSGGGRVRANKMFHPEKCWGCGLKDKSTGGSFTIERHHIDGNPANNSEENILFLCQKCHKAFHLGQGVNTVFLDEVMSIVSIGEEQTFDVCMIGPNHNFVADGLVVHNSQESTRYSNYARKGLVFIIPPWIMSVQPGVYGMQHSRLFRDGDYLWFTALLEAESNYIALLDTHQWTPQQARAVLPNSLKTELVMTANAREWRHIFDLRCAPSAHPQMREVMIPLRDEFASRAAFLFEPAVVE